MRRWLSSNRPTRSSSIGMPKAVRAITTTWSSRRLRRWVVPASSPCFRSVDAAVVVVEQTHKKLEHWNAEGRPGDYHNVVISAVKEVGGPSFFALLVIAVAFLPVFTLEAQEGRLFKPLAYTKNFAMAIAAVLAISLDPAMRLLFTHMANFNIRPRWLGKFVNAILVGKIVSEDRHFRSEERRVGK